MLKSAEFIREIQKRANDSYRHYQELKEKVSELIYFAACVGNGYCHFKTFYSEENKTYLRQIVGELRELGYEVNTFISKEEIALHITW